MLPSAQSRSASQTFWCDCTVADPSVFASALFTVMNGQPPRLPPTWRVDPMLGIPADCTACGGEVMTGPLGDRRPDFI